MRAITLIASRAPVPVHIIISFKLLPLTSAPEIGACAEPGSAAAAYSSGDIQTGHKPTTLPFLMMGTATVFASMRGSLALHRDEHRRRLLIEVVPPTLYSVP